MHAPPALSTCLQLTQRNHEKVWRKSLTAWRSLLHQKFSLLEVGVVGSRAGLCAHQVVCINSCGVGCRQGLCSHNLAHHCAVQAMAPLQTNMSKRCVHYWKAWVDNKVDWRSFQAQATQRLALFRCD